MREKARYSSKFFASHAAASSRSAELVVPILIDLFRPSSVIDVGCGVAGWLAVFREHGVSDICGIDGSWVEAAQLKIDPGKFHEVELAEPFRLGRRFDLVLSLEAAEHLPLKSAPGFVESIARLGPVIVFSAAVPFQGGTNHLNEQWPDFWIRLFNECGYQVFDVLRPRIWNMREVCYWYRQNMFIFIDKKESARIEMLTEATLRGAMPTNLVHPELLIAMHAYYERGDIRHLCRQAPRAMATTLAKLWRKLSASSRGKGGEKRMNGLL